MAARDADSAHHMISTTTPRNPSTAQRDKLLVRGIDKRWISSSSFPCVPDTFPPSTATAPLRNHPLVSGELGEVSVGFSTEIRGEQWKSCISVLFWTGCCCVETASPVARLQLKMCCFCCSPELSCRRTNQEPRWVAECGTCTVPVAHHGGCGVASAG